jgi:hypothetical protein
MTGPTTTNASTRRRGILARTGKTARARGSALSVRALRVLAFVSVVLTMLSPSSAWARTDRPHVSVSFVAVGSEVSAAGTVGAGTPHGDGSRSRWKAVLQQRVGSRWLTRATGGLRAYGHLRGFSLAWTGSAPGRRETVRVEITSGRRVVAKGAARSVVSTSPISVQSTLRASTVQPSSAQIVNASGSAGGTMVVVLDKGVRVPSVGSALVIVPSRKVPSGLLGVVTAVSHSGNTTSVTTKPGTLEDAYSSFDAHLDGNLEELANRGSVMSSAARAADISLGLFTADFSCDGSTHPSITHSINFREVEVHAEVTIPSKSNGDAGPGVAFWIGGHPKFDLGVQFSGETTCKAKASASIPIPDTPLSLDIGPDFTLHASGTVGVNLEWAPTIFYGFTRFYGAPANNFDSLKNGGKTSFSGEASLSLSFALEAGLSLDDNAAGVYGSLGPELTGTITTHTAPAQTCLKVDGDVTGTLSADAKAFFGSYTFTIGQFASPSIQIYQGCNTSGATGSGGPRGSTGGGSGGSGGGGGAGSGGSDGSPPMNTSPPTITDEQGNDPPQVGDTLHATTGVWNETPSRYSYQWENCEAAGSCSPISPMDTSSSYTLTEHDRGDTIRAVVTAYDSAGASAPVTTHETAVVGTKVTGISVYPDKHAFDWSVNGQYYLTSNDSGSEQFEVDVATHETIPVRLISPSESRDNVTRVADNGTILYQELTNINTGTYGLFVEPYKSSPMLIGTEATEYQLSEDGSTAVYLAGAYIGPKETMESLHSYDVATKANTVVNAWTSAGPSGTLFPAWLDYVNPTGTSAIFGFCRLDEETSVAEICYRHGADASWEAEGVLSFDDPSSPQLLPPPPPFEDNHEWGEPATLLEAAATSGTLILGQDTAAAALEDAVFVYEPGVGYKQFPEVEGEPCRYLDWSVGSTDEGQYGTTTSGISSNGRYVICSVEKGAHDSNAYMMDLATGRATLIYGDTYEPIVPYWISGNGTEAIFGGEEIGGGADENLKWVSPVDPLP